MKRCYWAHPWTLRKELADWAETVNGSQEIIQLIDPFHHNVRPEIQEQDRGERGHFEMSDDESYNIVEQDLALLCSCDMAMAYVSNEVSVGTHMEIVYARKLYAIPVWVIGLDGLDRHPWVIEHSEFIVQSLAEMEEALGI